MKTQQFLGNYLGICIANDDPEYRGRVKVFVPHIMPALYEGWNKEGKDIKFETVGDNVINGLPSKIISRLQQILPWAECAAPILGASTTTNYFNGINNQTGYNVSDISSTESPPPSENSLPDNSSSNFSPSSSSSSKTSQEVTRMLYEKFKEYEGSSERAKLYAAAIAGNIQQETNWNPHLTHDNNTGYGLLGWASRENDLRLNNLVAFAQSRGELQTLPRASTQLIKGSDIVKHGGISIKTQVDFIFKELYQPYSGAIARYDGAPKALEALRRSQTLDQATANFSNTFPRPGIPAMANRQKFASQIYNNFSLFKSSPKDLAIAANQPDPSSVPPPNPPTLTPTPDLRVNLEAASITPTNFNTQSKLIQVMRQRYPNFADQKSNNLCARGTRHWVGVTLGDNRYITEGIGQGGAVTALKNNYWTRFKDENNNPYYQQIPFIPETYKPQQGDIVLHWSATNPIGHTQVYLDGGWRSDFINDKNPNFYRNRGYTQQALFRLTDAGRQRLQKTQIASSNFEIAPTEESFAANFNEFSPPQDVGDSDYIANNQTTIIKHPSPTFPTTTNTTGIGQGAFSIPKVGAVLWVFFREGNPLFPVYFAASYGKADWAAAYGSASPDIHLPADSKKETAIRNKTVIVNGGGIELIGTNELSVEDPVASIDENKKDFRGVKIFAPSGAYTHWHAGGVIQYSPNEEFRQIQGNAYKICLNREDFTHGDNNNITLGDQFVIVGHISENTLNVIEKQKQIIKEINDAKRSKT